MEPIHHLREITSLIQKCLKLLDSLFLRQLQQELLLDLFMHVSVLDIRYIRVDHEGDEVEDQVRRFAQDGEASEAEVLEACVVHGLGATHGVDHFFADFDSGWEGLRVPTEDVPEVDVEEVAYMITSRVSDGI